MWKHTQNHSILEKLIDFELKKKADSKQLRNINFTRINKDQVQSLIEIMISSAKDQINKRKGVAVKWKVIPQLILDTFENNSIKLDTLI